MYLSGWQTIWHNWQIKEKTKEVSPMSKMAELDAAVAELRKCGETLIGVSDTLRELLSSGQEQSPASPPKPVEQPLTIEAVRKVLAQKSVDGHTAEIQALLRKYGAEKLSRVDPAHYADLLHDAEVL